MNPWSDDPIENASGMCYVLRRVSNDNVSRLEALDGILKMHPKVIIFYNFDYELAMLRRFLDEKSIIYAEKNGHKHESVPDTANSWVYLVNYGSGAEAWNCIATNAIVFFSQTYSYKTLVQAKGRVNRMNTPFLELYYYHLRCSSPIDRAIYMCLKGKKDFNESKFFGNRRTQY
jgi:superfamily II DNA or RNA helicase